MQEICNTAALPLDTNPLVRKIKCEEFPTIRGKQPTRIGMGVRDEMEEDFAVKARNTPPIGPVPGQEHPRIEHGGNSFWLAAVTAAGAPHPMLETCTETGFINSQPSMAEFMTALPQLGAGELSPQHTPPGYAPDLPSPGGGLNVPEYPWMKEKKTTRKSSQQGKFGSSFGPTIRHPSRVFKYNKSSLSTYQTTPSGPPIRKRLV